MLSTLGENTPVVSVVGCVKDIWLAAQKERSMSQVKQVIVLRADLKMRKGKCAAQASHASLKVFLDRKISPSNEGGNKDDKMLCIPLWRDAYEWVMGAFTKVCVRVESEAQLIDIYDHAQSENIPCSLVIDSGRTEFHGVPTATAVAIGPYNSEEIDKITGKLELY